MKRIFLCAAGCMLTACAATVRSADYPQKPVRLVVGFPAGSGVDILARLAGQKLTDLYSQSFVIENRPGAGTNIATAFVAKAPPDGYTLLMGTVANAINANLYAKLPFDFLRDFSAIAPGATAPNLLVIHPSIPARTVRDLIALAKAQPGKLSFGSSGTGTAPHLAGELFKRMAGIDVVHVPYKGGPQATTDLIGGQFAYLFAISSTVLPHVKTGRLRALAITTLQRVPGMDDIPTIAESGLPGFEAVTWFGFVAPAGTPRDIVTKLNTDIGRVLTTVDARQQLVPQGLEPQTGTPEQFTAYMRTEFEKWGRVVKESGAKAE